MAVAVDATLRLLRSNLSDGLVGRRRHIAGNSRVQFNALCDRVVAILHVGTYL